MAWISPQIVKLLFPLLHKKEFNPHPPPQSLTIISMVLFSSKGHFKWYYWSICSFIYLLFHHCILKPKKARALYSYPCLCSQDVEEVLVLIKTMVHLHNGILHSRKKEGAYTLCNSMDGTGEHYAKWNKAGGERQIPYDLTFNWNIINETKKQAKYNQRHQN